MVEGNFLLIYICNFHVLNHLLLIFICKLHWKVLMTMDKSMLMSPDDIALQHYQKMLQRLCLKSWHIVLSERGDICRIRDKCFAVWKVYAPLRKKMRDLTSVIENWQLLCVKAKAYRAMTLSCKDGESLLI